MKLIIQIPCFNEEQTLPQTLKDLPQHIDGIDTIETLIIDDGSSDKTSEVAQKHPVRHILRFTKNKGLARAFKAGLDAGVALGADIIVNTDADGQYKGEDIPRLVKPILEGRADIVIGNRDIEHVEQFSLIKKKLQRTGSWVVRHLTGSTIADTTTGFRAYNREAAMRLNILSDFTYTLETIVQAEYNNLAVHNINISTNTVKRKSRLFKSIPEYIKKSTITILRIYSIFNPLKFFVTLGTFITMCGVLVGARFLYYYLMGQGGGKIQSLILAATLIIIGFQVIVLGWVSDLISANRKLLEDTLFKVKKIELALTNRREKN